MPSFWFGSGKNPALTYQAAGQTVAFSMFDTLLTVKPDGSLGPGLADTWTIVNPTTIELKLHPGIAFHNDEPLDAAAVRFSIYRIMDRDPVSGEPIADDAAKLNSQWSRDFGAVARTVSTGAAAAGACSAGAAAA